MQLIERSPNSHMAFAAFALMLAKGKNDLVQSVELSKRLPPEHRRVETVLRAAVDAGTTADPGWAGSLVDYRQIAAGFIEGLRSVSAFDAMLPFARRLPLRTALAIVTATASGSTVAEGALKPITRLTLAAGGLEPQKATSIVVVSDELLRFGFSAAVDLLNAELRGGVSASTNQKFLSDLADGIVPVSSTGDPLADLRAALAVVSTQGTSRSFWIVSPAVAVQLATYSGSDGKPAFPTMTPNGGNIQGVSVLVSDQVPEDTNGPQSLIVDASQLALGDEVVTLRSTRQGDLVMDSAPGSGEQEVVSMFQTNSAALLAERWFGSQRLRDSAVHVISGADYPVAS